VADVPKSPPPRLVKNPNPNVSNTILEALGNGRGKPVLTPGEFGVVGGYSALYTAPSADGGLSLLRNGLSSSSANSDLQLMVPVERISFASRATTE